jgi:hypothetical protein
MSLSGTWRCKSVHTYASNRLATNLCSFDETTLVWTSMHNTLTSMRRSISDVMSHIRPTEYMQARVQLRRFERSSFSMFAAECKCPQG